MTHLPFRAITLLGHSGIGKTTLSELLKQGNWYHYSGDYRIATHYLHEAIADWLANLAAEVPQLAALLQKNALQISGKVRIEQLAVLSAYISKIGKQGLPYQEFCARQQAFAQAEKQAMYDIERFMPLAKQRFQKEWFINDAGGSLGEYIEDKTLMQFLAERTLFVYLDADEDLQQELEIRAAKYPKPICYHPEFLAQKVMQYGQENHLTNPDEFDSDDFLRFVGPLLLRHRRNNYRQLAAQYGVLLPVRKVWACQNAADFLALLSTAYQEQRG